jgi:hypothetical protein
MTRKMIGPLILFAINLGSAIVCLHGGDWKKAVYWLASSICILMVGMD